MARSNIDSGRVSKPDYSLNQRLLNARPDLTDFRDRMYEPTLVNVPPKSKLEDYLELGLPVLDQEREGACTGFGLATVAHYLLRQREDDVQVSPRMFYNMARRYDEYPGDDTDGSSPRGAMKGWHKHGVCSETSWPYHESDNPAALTNDRAQDAARRPLGAYLRVNHRDLVAMHCAISEVGILYAGAIVHSGWERPVKGLIQYQGHEHRLGGHAFAIVGYDEIGFWIQNSWGTSWGRGGLARLTYDDWLDNGADVWVARLGVPVAIISSRTAAAINADSSSSATAPAFHTIRPHIISLGNNGQLQAQGTYATTPEDLEQIFQHDAYKKLKNQNWDKPRLLLYAHGGLTSETSAVQRIADYTQPLLQAQIYPIMFSWRTDYWSTITNILYDALRRRTSGGVIESTKNFLLDRLDDALEPLARGLTGKLAWQEMKDNALAATTTMRGGLRLVARHLARLKAKIPDLEIHLAGHSAGAVLLAPFVQMLTEPGDIPSEPLKDDFGFHLPVDSCTLWAPACTARLFVSTYGKALERHQNGLRRLRLFTLSDAAEQDDNCAGIYNKSLLYLVSHAFEEEPRLPFYRPLGIPLAGMARTFLLPPSTANYPGEEDRVAVQEFQELYRNRLFDWVECPNSFVPENSGCGSTAIHHGDFDDDSATLRSLPAAIRRSTREDAVDAAIIQQYDLWKQNSLTSGDRDSRENLFPQRGHNFVRSLSSYNDLRRGLEEKVR